VLKHALGINPGESIEDNELASRIRKLGAGGEFERINFRLLGTGVERVLVVQPTEAAWGGNTLRFGVRLQSDFKSSNQFDLLAAHTLTWVNSYAGEWRNIMQIGGTRRFESEFYQPVTRNQDWFAAAAYGYRASDSDIFAGERRVARLAFSEKKIGLYVGRQLGLIGEFRVGRTSTLVTAEPLISQDPVPSASQRIVSDEAQLRIDTFDNANFPRHGYTLAAFWQRARDEREREFSRTQRALAGGWALSSGPYTLLSVAQFSEANRGNAGALGGFLSLSGTPVGSVTGAKTLFARMVGFRQIGQLPGALGGSIYAGASLELAGAFAVNESVGLGGIKRAGALLLGAETIVGPVYFGVGKTLHGSSAVYLFVGQP
jgi:NTE family protein